MTATSPEEPDDTGNHFEPSRVLTLTDGVVAIAMTLLALDLKPDVPEGETLAEYLVDSIPQYTAFLLAFLLIAQFWVVHHRMLRDVEQHDLTFSWVNMLFLLGVTLLPLVTYLIGEYEGPLPTTLFAADLLLISAALGLLRRLVHTRGMLHTPYTAAQQRAATARTITTLAIPALVIVVAWVLGGKASYLFFLYTLQEVPGRIVTRKLRSADRPVRARTRT